MQQSSFFAENEGEKGILDGYLFWSHKTLKPLDFFESGGFHCFFWKVSFFLLRFDTRVYVFNAGKSILTV